MEDEILESFYDIEIHKLFDLPTITVYKLPVYQGKFVARLWNLDKPTKYIILKDNIENIRNAIPDGFINMGKFPFDDPVIVETWI